LAVFTFAHARFNSRIGAAIRAQAAIFAASGVLTYQYDGDSVLGGWFGFKHALQDFQPLPNKLFGAKPGTSMAKVDAASASDLPQADLFQYLFSVLASGQWFPNTAICCYSPQNNTLCALQYEIQGQYDSRKSHDSRICENRMMPNHPR